MRIVLLGATGFVGHHLLPVLSAAGHQCIVLSRYRIGCREIDLVPGVELRQADVHNVDVLKSQLASADAVINMVGILNESGRGGSGFRKVHVGLVEKLIEACRHAGVSRLVHVSALNAGKGDSHYLQSKGQAENLIRNAQDLESTIIQPSVIFGDGDSFFNRFATLLKFAPVLPLACPDARMQPVWAGDVAAAMTAALNDPGSVGATLVMVGPEDYSLKELVERTAAFAGLKRRVVGLPDMLSRLQGRLMDFIPGKPFSSDNYRSLQIDNTSVENSLWRFGIRPRAIESVVRGYLGGSFHQKHLDRCRELSAGR
jgi:NADH dehydrogenase